MAISLQNHRHVNVGPAERVVSLVTGATLLSGAFKGRKVRLPTMLAGGYLIYRGASGRCLWYQALGIERARFLGRPGILVERSMTIAKPVEVVYRTWRDFERLPSFMTFLESVTVDENGRTHWVAKPLGRFRVEWDADLIADVPNRRIAWRSVPRSMVRTAGEVLFAPALPDRGTEVRVRMTYEPPAESAGAEISRLFGRDAARIIHEDLRRFKRLLEAGEVPSTDGQSHGPRIKRRRIDARVERPSAGFTGEARESGQASREEVPR